MTSKDYIILANALRTARINIVTRQFPRDVAIYEIVESVARALVADNARFDYDKFIAAVKGE